MIKFILFSWFFVIWLVSEAKEETCNYHQKRIRYEYHDRVMERMSIYVTFINYFGYVQTCLSQIHAQIKRGKKIAFFFILFSCTWILVHVVVYEHNY